MTAKTTIAVAFVFFLAACIDDVSAQNGTVVDNSTLCDYFASATTVNSTHTLCECDSGFTGNGTNCALEAKLECATDASQGFAFKVFLNQTYIDYYGYSQDSLALLNVSCGNATLESGYYVLFSPEYDQCGSVATNVSDTILYSNAVTSLGGTITSGDILYIPFSCSVASVLSISLNDDGNGTSPITIQQVAGSVIEFPVIEDTAPVKATMFMYQDANYATPYNGVPVLKTADMLYVEIGLENTINNINIISRECWATPESTGTSSERHDIIEEPGCLRSGVAKATITSNGVTSHSRFQLQVFTFMPTNVVYLHCKIELCTTTDGRTCEPTCSSRRRRRKRSTNQQGILRSTVIIRADETIVLPPHTTDANANANNNNDQQTEGYNTKLLLGVLISLTVILIVAIAVLLVYVCMKNRRKSF